MQSRRVSLSPCPSETRLHYHRWLNCCKDQHWSLVVNWKWWMCFWGLSKQTNMQYMTSMGSKSASSWNKVNPSCKCSSGKCFAHIGLFQRPSSLRKDKYFSRSNARFKSSTAGCPYMTIAGTCWARYGNVGTCGDDDMICLWGRSSLLKLMLAFSLGTLISWMNEVIFWPQSTRILLVLLGKSSPIRRLMCCIWIQRQALILNIGTSMVGH